MDEPSSRDTPQCLIYDGRCRMCVTAKGGLEQLAGEGKALRMIPYQSEEAERLLGPQYRGGRPEAAFLVAADGRIASGLDAFLPLLPGLKGGRVLARLFALPLVKPLGYWIYRLVAKYRYEVFGEVPLDRKD
jgi:predicted DCC family thiol-disulfide oxidoreductase YuxK